MTEPEVAISNVSDDVVKNMPHAQWLKEFAVVLGMTRPGSPPMTPFRQGAIAKLRLAARFIELQQKELHWVSKDNIDMRILLRKNGIDREPMQADAEKTAIEKGDADGKSVPYIKPE